MSAHTLSSDPFRPPRRIEIEKFSSHLETLEAELQDAGSILLIRDERAVARVTALQNETEPRPSFSERMPDFEAQLKEMWGDHVFPDSTPLIRADRDGE